MEEKERKSLSKFMALMLRHTPDKFYLEPDQNGFVLMNDAAGVLVTQRYALNKTQALEKLREVGAMCDKQRYEILDNKIRARYGHSIKQAITYEPAEPPEFLFHGTSANNIAAIKRDGLLSRKRQYVHMSSTTDMASSVGRRHGGTTVILKIRAKQAFQDGIKFFNPEPRIFLAEAISSKYIVFEDMDFGGRFGKITEML